MSDMVGTPNCWLSDAVTHIIKRQNSKGGNEKKKKKMCLEMIVIVYSRIGYVRYIKELLFAIFLVVFL